MFSCPSNRGRVVKTTDLKSVGIFPGSSNPADYDVRSFAFFELSSVILRYKRNEFYSTFKDKKFNNQEL